MVDSQGFNWKTGRWNRIFKEFHGYMVRNDGNKIISPKGKEISVRDHWGRCPNAPYKKLDIVIEGKRITYLRHRLVADVYIPDNDAYKSQVDHNNRVRGDDAVWNLSRVSPYENCQNRDL